MKAKTTLRESTSFSYEMKVLLDSLEMSDERPQALSIWAKKVFTKGKRDGNTLEEIAKAVEDYAWEKDYSERQIKRVLKDNGYNKQIQIHSSGRRHHFNYIRKLKDLAIAITGLSEQEIETAKPRTVANEAQPKILDIAARTTDAEKASLLHYVQLSDALLQGLEKTLIQSAKGIRLEP